MLQKALIEASGNHFAQYISDAAEVQKHPGHSRALSWGRDLGIYFKTRGNHLRFGAQQDLIDLHFNRFRGTGGERPCRESSWEPNLASPGKILSWFGFHWKQSLRPGLGSREYIWEVIWGSFCKEVGERESGKRETLITDVLMSGLLLQAMGALSCGASPEEVSRTYLHIVVWRDGAGLDIYPPILAPHLLVTPRSI